MYWAYNNAPISIPKMSSKNDRMIFTLQCHALTVVVLVHMVLVRVRWFQKDGPAAEATDPCWLVVTGYGSMDVHSNITS